MDHEVIKKCAIKSAIDIFGIEVEGECESIRMPEETHNEHGGLLYVFQGYGDSVPDRWSCHDGWAAMNHKAHDQWEKEISEAIGFEVYFESINAELSVLYKEETS